MPLTAGVFLFIIGIRNTNGGKTMKKYFVNESKRHNAESYRNLLKLNAKTEYELDLLSNLTYAMLDYDNQYCVPASSYLTLTQCAGMYESHRNEVNALRSLSVK
jgi:hypothetical protein